VFVTLKKDYLGHKAGATLDIHEESVAQALIAQGICKAVQGDPYGPLMAKALEASITGLSAQLDKVINKALEEFAKAQAKSRKNAVPEIFGAGAGGDPLHSFGNFCLCVAQKNHKRLEEHYKTYLVDGMGQKAALAEGSGSTGGYIVPPDFYQQLLALIVENAIIRPRAWVQPMGSATLQFPYLDVTTVQSAGVSPFTGGVQMYWTSEAQTRTEGGGGRRLVHGVTHRQPAGLLSPGGGDSRSCWTTAR
jgi:hypothetical protein